MVCFQNINIIVWLKENAQHETRNGSGQGDEVTEEFSAFPCSCFIVGQCSYL